MSDLPPTYVITLREFPHRRKATQTHFDESGIRVKWVYGINGSAAGIRSAFPHDYKDDGSAIFIHPKVLAVCLSQVFVLQMALLEGHDEFFVMEDDVVLCDGFKEKWLALRKSLPQDIDVIQCAVTCYEDKPACAINQYLEHRNWPFCCTCNWWRRDAAEFALKTVWPLNSPIDIIFADRVFPFLGHAITRERMAYDHSTMGKSGKWPSTGDEKQTP